MGMNLIKLIREELIREDNRRRSVIRQIVRDIIQVFKENDEGDFYLPEYFEDRSMIYEFPDFIEDLVVELKISTNNNTDNFIVDSNYYNEDDLIEVNIEYNPKDKPKLLYELIGELNEIIAHEIRHIDQKYKGLYNIKDSKQENSYDYYSTPHEIDAQIFGFNRLSKITKKPFEEVVKNWYKTHKDLHHLTDSESEKIINKILSIKNG